jgi:DNA-binding beta-propeller fold protein YncE
MKRTAVLLSVVVMACQTTTATQQSSPVSRITEVVVANQQSESASILSDDGTTMKHVHVGSGPHEAAVSPDGRVAVVTVYGTQTAGNRLAVIDLVRDSVVRTIDLGMYTRPHGAVFMGTSSERVAVTSESTGNVVIVDINTGALEAVPTNARASHMVALNGAGTRAWTANVADNTVSELDLVTKRFVRSVAVPARPEGIAATPDGAEVWVGSNDTGAVTVIGTATGQVTHTLTGARFPYRLGVSPDGTRMAVVDGMGNHLRIADVATHAYVGSIPLDSPRGVVIGADNRTAWVTLAAGQVVEVDIRDMRVIRTHSVQASPDGVGAGTRAR